MFLGMAAARLIREAVSTVAARVSALIDKAFGELGLARVVMWQGRYAEAIDRFDALLDAAFPTPDEVAA